MLVDSSVWIDYFRGTRTPETDLLDALLGVEEILVGDLILAEVLQGFRLEADFRAARAALGSCQAVPLAGIRICLKAARNFQALRRRSVTVRKTIDTIIATCCIENGYTLLYGDREFDPFVHHLGLRSALPRAAAGTS